MKTENYRADPHKCCIYLMTRDAPDIRPDNPAFFISGIRPDTGYGNRISGQISYKKIHLKTAYNILQSIDFM